MSVESVHSLREENVELRELEDARLNSRQSSRHTSRSSSRQSQSRPSSVLEGLLTNLAQNVGQQGEMMKTLAEQSTSTHTKLSDISRSQYELSHSQHELSRSQTLIQSRLAKVEETLSVVVTGPSGNDFVSYAAPLDVAAPSTTHTSIEEPPFVTISSSALASGSLLELNPPFLRRRERLKEKEKRKTEERSLDFDSETHAVSLERGDYEKSSFILDYGSYPLVALRSNPGERAYNGDGGVGCTTFGSTSDGILESSFRRNSREVRNDQRIVENTDDLETVNYDFSGNVVGAREDHVIRIRDTNLDLDRMNFRPISDDRCDSERYAKRNNSDFHSDNFAFQNFESFARCRMGDVHRGNTERKVVFRSDSERDRDSEPWINVRESRSTAVTGANPVLFRSLTSGRVTESLPRSQTAVCVSSRIQPSRYDVRDAQDTQWMEDVWDVRPIVSHPHAPCLLSSASFMDPFRHRVSLRSRSEDVNLPFARGPLFDVPGITSLPFARCPQSYDFSSSVGGIQSVFQPVPVHPSAQMNARSTIFEPIAISATTQLPQPDLQLTSLSQPTTTVKNPLVTTTSSLPVSTAVAFSSTIATTPAAPVTTIITTTPAAPVTTSPAETVRSKNVLKLDKFDGRSDYRVFRRKFAVVSAQNSWSPSEQMNFLICSLTGEAAQIGLMDDIDSVDELLKRLDERFGSTDRESLFLSELNARRQKESESILDFYSDLKRLSALAFSGKMSLHASMVT